MEQPPRTPLVSPALLGLLACAAAFTWLVNHGLPDPVASHFDPAGDPDGFMPRAEYIGIMMAVTVLAPLFIATLSSLALSRAGTRINLPDRDHWLAPERRAETVGFLRHQSSQFAALLVLFMCYAQWLAARANATTPPTLDSGLFFLGLGVFIACVALLIVRLVRRFRRG
jgi:uncharacterized membrane protein